MWERELEIIESLGKLYPTFDRFVYDDWRKGNIYKAWWVWYLCRSHLKQRIPQLEKFMKANDCTAWDYYRYYFKITDGQCGKKS